MNKKIYFEMESTVIRGTMIVNRECHLRRNDRKYKFGDHTYSKFDGCTRDNPLNFKFLRKEEESIYVYSEHDSTDQKLFDFSGRQNCWQLKQLSDQIEICLTGKYTHKNFSVYNFRFDFKNNVSDYPVLEECHVSPDFGIIRMKFSDGEFTYSLVNTSFN